MKVLEKFGCFRTWTLGSSVMGRTCPPRWTGWTSSTRTSSTTRGRMPATAYPPQGDPCSRTCPPTPTDNPPPRTVFTPPQPTIASPPPLRSHLRPIRSHLRPIRSHLRPIRFPPLRTQCSPLQVYLLPQPSIPSRRLPPPSPLLPPFIVCR